MKSMFQFIAAVACVAALTACGGGSKAPVAVVVPQPAFKLTDTVVGTGAAPKAGDIVVINFTGYLYDSTKADFKGAKVESSVDTGKPATPFTVGLGAVVAGWDQSILGVDPVPAMKIGGKRTAILPANLVYGATTRVATGIYPAIPANSPMVYDFELVDVIPGTVIVPVPPPTVLTIVNDAVGTGAVAASGKTVTVRYTGWLYDGTRADYKGPQFDSNVTATDPAKFVLGSGDSIAGFSNGIIGMAVGGTRTVTIPPDQGYGAAGKGSIPPNATLIFQIQLITVN
ncbi:MULTISPECIES: FKBP-type peptidyl-prolyl cis-trans isomerase [unclassified Duganella]|uniref:FKBP-type peptidyl-prolyl cis-trans isomerase n=1 Tax=unclassified Duganella TaxID=2636909 RepID=UPI000E344BEB|nr:MULTISPECIES: FKBP-type peptidyl-prolyl cis-trans isomerase [unclassified Duganella]RFP12741.1 FKBP-type peptidylprolyl isomerase [Duganella sp. BJB475]RFP28750.1 FKBP-type peptidylprolyl isomerase [Duganella sp. BJB476]